MGLSLAGAGYAGWASRSKPSEGELAGMKREAAGFIHRPRVSLVLVVSDEDEVWIRSSIDSVLGQAYPYLELRVCDNGSRRPHVREVLEGYAAREEGVTLLSLPEKVGRAEAYNAGLLEASGELVTVMDAGDELAPEALFKVVEVLQHTPADAVYADEDRIDVAGVRSDPVFKPYWSPEMLLSEHYTGRPWVMSGEVFDHLGGVRTGLGGAEEYDLVLRFSERTGRAVHLPEVLYHRRRFSSKDPPGTGKGDPRRVVQDALARRGSKATVETGRVEGSLRVTRRVGGTPTVGVVVFAPDWMENLPFVKELEENALYPIHRLVVAGVGEASRPSLDDVNHPFPASAANLAAGRAGGDYLAFVDARAHNFSRGWLLGMLGEVQRPLVGAVGCRLLDGGGGLRHGGSVVDVGTLTGSSAEPVFRGGNYLPVVDHPFDMGFAPAECMVVRRDLFESVGGFDEENLPTSFYDLDLCFRLQEAGRRVVYTPHASVTLGGPRGTTPETEEIAYIWHRWWARLVRLLYYRQSPLSRQELERDAVRIPAAEDSLPPETRSGR